MFWKWITLGVICPKFDLMIKIYAWWDVLLLALKPCTFPYSQSRSTFHQMAARSFHTPFHVSLDWRGGLKRQFPCWALPLCVPPSCFHTPAPHLPQITHTPLWKSLIPHSFSQQQPHTSFCLSLSTTSTNFTPFHYNFLPLQFSCCWVNAPLKQPFSQMVPLHYEHINLFSHPRSHSFLTPYPHSVINLILIFHCCPSIAVRIIVCKFFFPRKQHYHPLWFHPVITMAPKAKLDAIVINPMLSPSMDLDYITLANRDYKITKTQFEFDLFELHCWFWDTYLTCKILEANIRGWANFPCFFQKKDSPISNFF